MAEQLYKSVFTGPRAIIKINSTIIGHATDVSVTVNSQVLPVEVLGEVYPEALLEVGRSATITCRYVKLIRDALSTHAILPRQVDTLNIVNWPEVDIEVYDNKDVTNNGNNEVLICKVIGCRCVSRNMSISARTITMVDSQWVGRIFLENDEQY